MEFRCSPYNPLLYFGVLGIFIFCSQHASAQCKGDFTYQTFSAEKGSASGKIEIEIKNPGSGNYTFKVYEMTGSIAIVETRQAASPEKTIFENLKASTYFVKVEWGESCYKTLGGREGIIITEKDQGR
jgi:hypothetical protein